jgi:hypothetical protein
LKNTEPLLVVASLQQKQAPPVRRKLRAAEKSEAAKRSCHIEVGEAEPHQIIVLKALV